MKKKLKKNTRMFLIGLVSGFILWAIIDVAFNWDDNVRDYWRGHDAGKEKWESK